MLGHLLLAADDTLAPDRNVTYATQAGGAAAAEATVWGYLLPASKHTIGSSVLSQSINTVESCHTGRRRISSGGRSVEPPAAGCQVVHGT